MKNVLIVTYYWPPSGGGGVQRWLKFCKYLPEFGWKPTILTPENPNFDIKDYSLLDFDQDKVKVIKIPIWEPTSAIGKISKRGQGQLNDSDKSFISGMLIWLRGNLFIPDQRKYWKNKSVRYLRDYLTTNSIDVIITTGPPHSMHLIGRDLKRISGIKWIADFRDPWSKWDILNQMRLTPIARSIHKKMELSVITEADLVIAASKSWAFDLRELGAKNTDYITNGYDETDFHFTDDEININRFQIGYYGMINQFRIPQAFLDAVKSLCQEDEKFRKEVHIVFTGIISDSFIKLVREDLILKEIISFNKYIPHLELLKDYKKNFALLLIQNASGNSHGHIPGKFFEYLASKRWIIFQGEKNSDTGRILEDTGRGFIFIHDDQSGAKESLIRLFEMFKNRQMLPDESQVIHKYSRRNLTGELSKKLNNLIS